MQTAGGISACLPIHSDLDLVWVRQHVRQAAAQLGFGLVEQTKLVTAASELARNTLVHGGGGQMECAPADRGGARGLRLIFSDEGPGIADLDQALVDGYTSGEGLGMGLGGARRLVHEFAIDSRPGSGTTVTVTSWMSGAPRPREER
ncbi:anti-sigma regulatory factor [Streptomyces europaeiscabiei]|uniref:Anti-sigma regulatory factor n=1 Tax=Streptomyces europaeiscabiei TaxID=146819 RepID=A0ABU4NEK1_9ACTN|nr:anti-sigma regulatory factor [Streptomyces europaeiscabiei]MDX2526416.1 anti-sigma regulatory factor [Streptomyces europaeiscabiei]MDX2758276.1 anti-sigma regulatory factor [Streptomyces europaeiscabiei]MDX3544005.1 anti-sigma regulatory factor [Streptomyces europaeiscabiei]MDX3552239.1 anti-sigma regulatory factor [Streptomyces europaeiscabiei]MDX3665726.1 anti-sigma regulatory factor [Streptomyces europaeiscabiei]